MVYDESVIIPRQERRLHFPKYIQEVLRPSDPKRQVLAKDFVEALYSLRPDMIFGLHRDPRLVPSIQNENPFYLGKVESILYFLSWGCEDYYTEDEATSRIMEELAKLPKDLEDDLKTESLKLWKITRLGFMYFGDLARVFDIYIYLHMAAFLIHKRVPKEEAITMLMEQHRSPSTHDVFLKYYLASIDIHWAVRDLWDLSPIKKWQDLSLFKRAFSLHEKDAIEIDGYKIIRKWKCFIGGAVADRMDFYRNNRKIAVYKFHGGSIMNSLLNGKLCLDKSGRTEASIEQLGEFLRLLANMVDKLSKL